MSIYSKLFEIQKQNLVLTPDAVNPFHKNMYVSIENLMNSLKPLLAEQGLLIYHTVKPDYVETHLVEIVDDGKAPQEIISHFPINSSLDAQKKWAEVTYGKRYNILALFALTEDDDDGNTASWINDKKEPVRTTQPERVSYARTEASSKGLPEATRWLEKVEIDKYFADVKAGKEKLPWTSDSLIKRYRTSGVGVSKKNADYIKEKFVEVMTSSIFHTPDVADVPF